MQKDLDLFAAYRAPAAENAQSRRLLFGGVIALAACTVSLIAWSVSLHVAGGLFKAQSSSIQRYLDGREVASANSALASAQSQIAALNDYAKTAGSAVSALGQNARLDSGVIAKIQAALPADVQLQSLGYQNGAVTLSCTCADKLSPARFAQALSQTDAFTDVNYTGFGGGQAGSLSFSVTFTVKGGGAQ